jgi:hypothetical protein
VCKHSEGQVGCARAESVNETKEGRFGSVLSCPGNSGWRSEIREVR